MPCTCPCLPVAPPQLNGLDAANDVVMWLHQGDSKGRRSAVHTAMIRADAGDKVFDFEFFCVCMGVRLGVCVPACLPITSAGRPARPPACPPPAVLSTCMPFLLK
jgi:hypothetical protein